ncbi:MAG: copper amine oxidase N-terminal domain-containing protein [Syntrophomonadaceae bacterium]
MIKIRNKRIAFLLVLTMLATMFVGVGLASAGDPVKVSSSWATVTADDNQIAGKIQVKTGDYQVNTGTPAATLYMTIDLPSGVEWATLPTAADVAFDTEAATAGTAVLDGPATETSVTYRITGNVVSWVTFQNPNVNIDSGFEGNVVADVSLQNVVGALNVWSFDASPIIDKVGVGQITATAADAEKYNSAPFTNKAIANITVKENQAGVLKVDDEVSFSIANDGVTFNTATLATTGALTFGAPVYSADDSTVTFTVTAVSATIGAKAILTATVDASPVADDGDVTVDVSSTSNKMEDASLVVATIGQGEFDVSTKNYPTKDYVQGQGNVKVAQLKIEPTTAFDRDGSIELTLAYGKWAANPVAPAGWTAGTRYNDDRSIWFTQDGTADTGTKTFTLPNVNIDANAPVGELMVTIEGNAGVTGDYGICDVVDAASVAADKVVVKTDALDQAAGNITITELVKDGFHNAGNLKLALPNGIYFSKNPKVFFNGKEVKDIAVVADTGKGYNTIEWTAAALSKGSFNNAKLEKLEIQGVVYDVDSRFVSKDITVEIKGLVMTGTGGSTKTTDTIANAVGQSENTGSASFTIGSTSYVINGVTNTMDVAPYAKDNRTYLPIRYVAYALQIDAANIIWDQASQAVTLVKGDKAVQVKLGSKQMLINGVPVMMDVAPEASNGRVFLPYRFLAEAYGATVTWVPPSTVNLVY